MSRCKACDIILNEFEMTQRERNKYIDLCLKCLSTSNETLLEGKTKIELRSYDEVMEMLNDQ